MVLLLNCTLELKKVGFILSHSTVTVAVPTLTNSCVAMYLAIQWLRPRLPWMVHVELLQVQSCATNLVDWNGYGRPMDSTWLHAKKVSFMHLDKLESIISQPMLLYTQCTRNIVVKVLFLISQILNSLEIIVR